MKYRINYSKVISQADDIEGSAGQLSAQIKQLTQLEQECRSVWKGQAADSFCLKLKSLIGEMNKTKSQMSNLASTIKYCANRIQREDQEAERQAKALNSGR